METEVLCNKKSWNALLVLEHCDATLVLSTFPSLTMASRQARVHSSSSGTSLSIFTGRVRNMAHSWIASSPSKLDPPAAAVPFTAPKLQYLPPTSSGNVPSWSRAYPSFLALYHNCVTKGIITYLSLAEEKSQTPLDILNTSIRNLSPNSCTLCIQIPVVNKEEEWFPKDRDGRERMALGMKAKGGPLHGGGGSDVRQYNSEEIQTPTRRQRDKRVAGTALDGVDNMPPAKRMKTTEAVRKDKLPDTTIQLSTARHKTINLNLPASCFDDNAWRGVFIPTIAHAAGGENTDPWFIDDDSLIKILVAAWRVVYSGNPPLKHCIDAVLHASKQWLNLWRVGFGSAAIVMITSIMASDPPSFATYEQRSEFANFYLEGNRFLFKNYPSDDKKEWTGMWQSPFILKILVAHLDYTRGRAPVEFLGSEEQHCRIALALSAAAVKRALRLLSTGQMSFEVATTVAKGKKKAIRKSEVQAHSGDIWKIMMSGNDSFSESLWGYDSRMFLNAINRVPQENMLDIVKDAEAFIGTATGQPEINSSQDIDEEYVDLFHFR
ncbi:hypothetical protein DEU56DRAFT_983316 [Suillus clintonianus]|uniref:uncharacterized protein n=1 Tax=Suillus clintonianus TaxID=1904413 RepID=UPI001B871145|nr:uncharacterized protein DEU56DRAFT_983316 [Suillus clintonianus]KAG2125413.1 hypothetical protein DEU56DRAFT_983316 [Suillus clintonianus]